MTKAFEVRIPNPPPQKVDGKNSTLYWEWGGEVKTKIIWQQKGATSFPGSLFLPPKAIAFGGKKRDPGKKVKFLKTFDQV